MSGGGSRHVGAPRTLQVQQFANARGIEVQALHAVLKEKTHDGNQEISRCLRRRTTSHNRRKSFFWQKKASKKRKLEEEEGEGEKAVKKKRKLDDDDEGVKKVPCRRVRRRIELKGDKNGGGGCSRDGSQRLVTHVWHAKRFTMTKIWGHWLAQGLPGRGRGSRAVIKWKNEAAVLHDASFYSAIELEGSVESILEALQLVLEPAPSRSVEDQSVLSGAEYGKAMLHHIGQSPRGAIAPVTCIWRCELIAGERRRMWLWVHGAAFEEALACLQLLCQNQDKVQCWSRKGQYGRLDLVGCRALSVLQKVLHPITRLVSQEGSADSVLSTELPAGAVVEMSVWDPRCRTSFKPSLLSDDETKVEVKESRSSQVATPDIWGTRQGSMALSEKELSSRRHENRLSYIQLSDKTQDIGTENLKCSIMILKHDEWGYSLLLPIGWVRAFWVPLVFAGGHVVGLRERHWLRTDVKLPCFPDDYPDCHSYDRHMAEKSAEYDETYKKKPPSKRGLWKSEALGWKFVHEAAGNLQLVPSLGEEEPSASDSSKTMNDGLVSLPSNHLTAPKVANDVEVAPMDENHNAGSHEASSSQPDPSLSPQPVATTDTPGADTKEVPKGGKTGAFVARTRATFQKFRSDSSLLARVLIHAPRKGVFDEGAIIYLPQPSDIDFYFNSSSRWQGFEDPSFKQAQQPRKKLEKTSLRVPMGIITSGSVRGSASEAAIGFCEVAALNAVRATQNTDTRWPGSMSEIFVLARNAHSSMYRPALASIVVESSDDLE